MSLCVVGSEDSSDFAIKDMSSGARYFFDTSCRRDLARGCAKQGLRCNFDDLLVTPPKFNIAPEKWWLEDYVPIGKIAFQGVC